MPQPARLPDGEDVEAAERALRVGAHRTLQGVTADHEGFRWNTIVAKLMELTNLLMRYRGTPAAGTPGLGRGRPPAAPDAGAGRTAHRRGALGAAPGGRAASWSSIHTESWPAFDPALVAADQVEVPVQVNGKLRDKVLVAPGLSEAEIEAIVMAQPKVIANLEGKQVVKVIHVGGRLVNIVVR